MIENDPDAHRNRASVAGAPADATGGKDGREPPGRSAGARPDAAAEPWSAPTLQLLRDLGALSRRSSGGGEPTGERDVLHLLTKTLAELAFLVDALARRTPAPPDVGPDVCRAEERGAATGAAGVLKPEGEYWTIAWRGEVRRIRDVRGLHYIARLLRDPGREFHVLDLATAGCWMQPPAAHGVEVLDAPAKAAYRQRLSDLQSELAEAERLGDDGRAARVHAEREALTEQLAAAVGLGGRDRRAADAAERARSTVTQAIRTALKRVHAALPALGDELRLRIRTGVHCVYLPDPDRPTTWSV